VWIHPRVQATDFALNPFTSLTSTFTWNTALPSVSITPQAPNNGFYSAVQVSTPFAGTATPAAVSGVVISTVTLTLQDLTAGTSYYNGNAWGSGLATFPAQGPASGWSFNSLGLVFVADHQYQLTAKALDNAGISAFVISTFVYDVQHATTSVTTPANGSYVTSLTTLSGKATDQIGAPVNPSGLATNGVAVAIQQVGGSWWSGASFTDANAFYSTATYTGASSGTWLYTVPAALQNALVSGNQYFLVPLSTDTAGNAEFNSIPAGVGNTFTYNTVAPTATITLPLNNLPGIIPTLNTISGTANGTVGLSNVMVAVQSQASGQWMNQTNFGFTVAESTPSWIPVTYLAPSTTFWAFTAGGSLDGKLIIRNYSVVYCGIISPTPR